MVTSRREWSLTLCSVTKAFLSGTLPAIATTIPEMVQSCSFAVEFPFGDAAGADWDWGNGRAEADIALESSKVRTIERVARMGHPDSGVYDTRRGEVCHGLPRVASLGRERLRIRQPTAARFVGPPEYGKMGLRGLTGRSVSTIYGITFQ